MAKNKFTIVFENENYIAVDKPSGLLTIPDRQQSEKSLKEYLIEKYGQIFTIHRLDKDTSGLLLFAKNEETHKFFSKLFEDRNIQKYYIGVVLGQPDPAQGEIEASIGEHPLHKGLMNVHRNGKVAHTSYEVLDGNKNLSLVRFQLHTGRTHQIRVHAKEIGHPLAADPLYGDGKSIYLSTYKKKFKLSKHDEEERPMIDRLALHSYQLIFTDNSGNAQNLQTAIPKNFTVLLKQLHKL